MDTIYVYNKAPSFGRSFIIDDLKKHPDFLESIKFRTAEQCCVHIRALAKRFSEPDTTHLVTVRGDQAQTITDSSLAGATWALENSGLLEKPTRSRTGNQL